MQTEDHAGREELFTHDYAYFSSMSTSWLAHAQQYVGNMVQRLGLGQDSTVVEVAANDGYLLQYVAQAGIPCYGIEPTASTSAAAKAKDWTLWKAFLAWAWPHSLQPKADKRTWWRPTTCWPTYLTSTTLWPGLPPCSSQKAWQPSSSRT